MITKYIPINTKRRPGLKLLGVKFIVCHDTGNPNSTAMGNVNYYIKSANEITASAHVFIDDKEVICCIPLDEKAYHVRRIVTTDNALYGVDAIDWSLGIELCYFPSDILRSKAAYFKYVAYIAELCKNFTLSLPDALVGHYKLDPARRADPLNAFRYINKTWEQFIEDVKNEIKLDEKLPENCVAEKKEINSLKKVINDLLVYIKSLWG